MLIQCLVESLSVSGRPVCRIVIYALYKETVHQVAHLPELYQDARPAKYKRRSDSSLLYLNRVIIKESWFLILPNFS